MRTAVALGILIALGGSAEIIDRVAVIVGERVITESEILRQVRITALLNGQKPEFGPESRRETADRLVEQTLIRKELESSRFMPSPAAAKEITDQVTKRFGGIDGFREAVRQNSLTEAEVREAIAWQATFLEFVAARFRPAIQISDAEIKDYYENEVAVRPGEAKPALEAVRAEIESILTDRHVDNALDRWLGGARTQTQIRYKDEVFR